MFKAEGFRAEGPAAELVDGEPSQAETFTAEVPPGETAA
jgi:hypothetical protein